MWRRALAIAHARPERLITLTDVGVTWSQVRSRMKRVRHEVAKRHRIEWCWSIEANPRGTGLHVHAWQRGGFIPQKLLSEVSRREGMGVVADIRFVANPDRRRAQYSVKSAGYTLKEAAKGSLSAQEWIALNGGRLTHQSRGFFGEGGVRVAERAALLDHFGEAHQWEVRQDRVHAARARARYARWQRRPAAQPSMEF